MKKYTLLFAMLLLAGNLKAEIITGEPCGENCTWEIDTELKTLTISGSGAMKDYERINCLTTGCTTSAPWREYYKNVQKVVIGEKITTVGNSAFEDMTSVTDVQLPSTLISIGRVAFENVQITTIDLPESLKSIGLAAFHTQSFTSLLLPESLEEIDEAAFRHTTEAIIPESVTNLDPLAFGDHEVWWGSQLTKLYCSAKQMEQCKAVGEKTGVEPVEYKKTQNGRYLVGGKQYLSAADLQAGKVFTPKLIYTVEEAMEATKNGDKFHVYLTYK